MRHLVLLGALAACAGDDDTDDVTVDTDTGEADVPSCGFTGTFTGAAEATLDYGEDEACSGSGYDDRLAMSFGLDEPWWVSVEIASGVVPGEPASGLPATVEIADAAVGYDGWRTGEEGCTVDVIEMIEDDFFDWIVVGEGSCSEPATPDTTEVTGEVTVGPFTFRAPAPFP